MIGGEGEEPIQGLCKHIVDKTSRDIKRSCSLIFRSTIFSWSIW